MCRVEANPCVHKPLPWPGGIPAAGACPGGGLNQHRLAERPVLNDLLEHRPGDVPYSTHLEIEAARARLVHRQLGAALERLDGARPDYGRLAAAKACREQPEAAPARERNAEIAHNVQQVRVYRYARRAWPVGGLMDLVV